MRPDWRTPFAAVIVLVLGLALLPGPADARPQDGDLEGSGHRMPTRSQPNHWYGAKKLGEVTAYCIDLNSGSPQKASAWTEYTNYTLLRQTGWGGPTGEHGNGTRKTLVAELAELSWILHETGPSPAADVGAAVEHTVRLRTLDGVEQERKEQERWSAVSRAHPGTVTQFQRLQEEAAAFAGPYTLEVTWAQHPSPSDPTGELDIRVLSASGNPVPNRPVAVAGSGELGVVSQPATTDATGIARATIQLPEPTTGPVSGAIAIEVSDLPGQRPRLFVPREKTIQRLVAAPAPISLVWKDEVLLEPEPWQPTVSTRTRDVIATAGSPAVDVITVEGGRPGTGFTGSSTLFGPFTSLEELATSSSAAAPAVGVAFFKGTYNADGFAEVHSTALEFPSPGYYMWHEVLDAADLVVPPPAPEWPQVSETSIVLAPAVGSELLLSGAPFPGVTVADTLDLVGIPEPRAVPGSEEPLAVRASGQLLGPVSPVGPEAGCEAVDWEGAPVLARYEDLEMLGETLDELLQTNLEVPGCYTASAHIQVWHDGRVVAEVAHAPGLPSQSVQVLAPPKATPPPSPSPPPPSATPPTPEPTPPATTPPPEAAPPTQTTPPPPEAPSTPPAPPPLTTSPPEPGTPRINSGAPIKEVRWHLVHMGLVMSFIAVGARLRSSGRRP